MPDTPTLPLPAVDEGRLRKLLTSRKPADEAELQAWLALTSPDDAARLLAANAKDARSPTQQRIGGLWLLCFLSAFGILVYLTITYLFDEEFLLFHYSFLLSTPVISLVTQSQTRGGVRATLLLARTGDTRAVQCLANFWTPRPLTRREITFNADVTRKLTGLLSARQGDRYDLDTEKGLRGLLERAFPAPKKRLSRLRPLPRRRTTDLTEADTDLLLNVVRHLSQRDPNLTYSEPQADDAVVRRVAGASSDMGGGEHRTLLRDTAQVLLTGRGGSV